MQETTLSSTIPAANVVGILSKVRLPSQDFMSKEEGVMLVDHSLGEKDLFKVLKILTLEQAKDVPEAVTKLVDAMIMDLTTCSSLSEEERDVLWTIVKNGGKVKLEVHRPVSSGMKSAMQRVRWRGQCECGFVIPKYPGRYPAKCPQCDAPLMNIDSDMQWLSTGMESEIEDLLDYLSILAEARSRGLNGTVIGEQKMSDGVMAFYKSLSAASARAFHKAVSTTYFDPKEEGLVLTEADLTEVSRAPYYLSCAEMDVWAPILESMGLPVPELDTARVFRALVDLVDKKSPHPFRDAALRESFRVFSVSPGITVRLRTEVFKRKALIESLKLQRRKPDKFNLLKALSSCFTRVMIEGQSHKGDSSYTEVGKIMFAMMERAFAGDLATPSRFLDLYFLEGNESK